MSSQPFSAACTCMHAYMLTLAGSSCMHACMQIFGGVAELWAQTLRLIELSLSCQRGCASVSKQSPPMLRLHALFRTAPRTTHGAMLGAASHPSAPHPRHYCCVHAPCVASCPVPDAAHSPLLTLMRPVQAPQQDSETVRKYFVLNDILRAEPAGVAPAAAYGTPVAAVSVPAVPPPVAVYTAAPAK
eukprot:351882-Chlamydomonas_euryale.AAC.22